MRARAGPGLRNIVEGLSNFHPLSVLICVRVSTPGYSESPIFCESARAPDQKFTTFSAIFGHQTKISTRNQKGAAEPQ